MDSMDDSQTAAESRVAIVLVNWNGWRDCVECIDSLFAQNHQNFHAFIVDNDSQDGSIDKIRSWCAAPKADTAWRTLSGVRRLTDQPHVGFIRIRVAERAEHGLPPPPEGCRLTLIRAGGNMGFAGGCNVGITAAGLANFEYFWFLNPDTVVDQRALIELIRRAEDQPGIGIVGATLRYYDQPDIIQALGGASLNRSNGTSRHIGQGVPLRDAEVDASAVEGEMAYVMGACMFVSRRFIAEVGLMEEDYFLYYEEIDWALRGISRFSLGYAPRSHVFHKSGANSSRVMPLFTAGFYYRNRLRFVARFLPGRLRAAKWSLFEGMMRHVANGRWAHARVILTTLLTAGRITANVSRRY
jgi:GT2 family glycosyltransferase